LPEYGVLDLAEPDDVRGVEAAVLPFEPLIQELCESTAVAGNWGADTWVVKEDPVLPNLEAAMACFRVLQFRAIVDLALQQPAEARRAVEAQFRLARIFCKTPTVMMHLVALTGTTMARDAFWRGLELGLWDDAALRGFAAEFLASNALADHLWSMETERAQVRELLERCLGNAGKIMTTLQGSDFKPSKLEALKLRLLISRRSWWRDNQLWFERSQDEVASMLDAQAQVWRRIERKHDPEQLTHAERAGDLALAASLAPALAQFARKSVVVHAQNKMAALACALELCRRATGNYPQALEELVPAYLPRLPVDPATGRGFRYEPQSGGSYQLFSIGLEDLQPNGLPGVEWRWWAPRLAQPALDVPPTPAR
jgi:hypothetical protein